VEPVGGGKGLQATEGAQVLASTSAGAVVSSAPMLA